MEAIKREKLLSLSSSVKVLLEKIVGTKLSKTAKEILVDLQDALYYANNKLIPSQPNNKLLDLLRRDVLKFANLLEDTDFLRSTKRLSVIDCLPRDGSSDIAFCQERMRRRNRNIGQNRKDLENEVQICYFRKRNDFGINCIGKEHVKMLLKIASVSAVDYQT